MNSSVQEGLLKNMPEMTGMNADPLRYGKDWLLTEINHVKSRYEVAGFDLFYDSPLENSLLPFGRRVCL